LYITVEGEPNADTSSSKCGMVMDFGDLKRIVYENIIDKYDHALVLNEKAVFENSLNTKLIRTSFQPTCENMLIYFYETLRDKLPHGVRLCKLRMYETATSYAELVL
jgi:6-pyruvoyltetrahydropterin/6-carboxytetrahydropterin synthase